MKVYKVEHILEAIAEIESDITKRRMDAGYAGRMDDGGATRLKEKLVIFETMWDGNPLPESRVPRFIEPVLMEAERKHDPEYQKYLELKAKFEK